jgi:methylenetetrahydrofolate reductase (NADPH)
LTGDPPQAGDHPEAKTVYDLSVMELVGLADRLRRDGTLLSGARIDAPPRYFIGVADVPLSPGYTFDRLEEKADAGADFVQTQIVFDVEAFDAWAERARDRGIFERMFVLAGVAVARGAKSARYIRDHLPGVMVPDRVIELLEDAGPDAEREGVRLTVEVVAKLKTIQGIAGIHVMGLGQMDPVRHVIESAGLMPRPAMA